MDSLCVRVRVAHLVRGLRATAVGVGRHHHTLQPRRFGEPSAEHRHHGSAVQWQRRLGSGRGGEIELHLRHLHSDVEFTRGCARSEEGEAWMDMSVSNDGHGEGQGGGFSKFLIYWEHLGEMLGPFGRCRRPEARWAFARANPRGCAGVVRLEGSGLTARRG